MLRENFKEKKQKNSIYSGLSKIATLPKKMQFGPLGG